MATNPYFQTYTYEPEAKLQEDLTAEAIKIHGLTCKYMPRTVFNAFNFLGEDPLSQFTEAVEIELWIKSNTGFGGERDFLSKFNLELRDQVTFSMARNRWFQICTEKLLDETSYLYQDESADTYNYANSISILLEAGTANGYSITSSRPMEGDLIYFAPSKDLFEIKFVEHEDPFYPHGVRFLYNLSCEKFRYSSERFQTGNTVLDTIDLDNSLDIRLSSMLLEDATMYLDEDTAYRLVLEQSIEDQAPAADNATIIHFAKDAINFSETSPFGEIDRV